MKLGSVAEVSAMSGAERIAHMKEYIVAVREAGKARHEAGASGVEVCAVMSDGFDALISMLYSLALEVSPEMGKVALVANGGYGRGQLFAGSDIDILFLTHKAGASLSKPVREAIDVVLYGLWDLNLKVGHAVRSTGENIAEGKQDAITRTTLLDSRLIVGNEKLFLTFQQKFRKEAILNDRANFFRERSADLEARYEKFNNTVFLQEPNLKESPGGLRDWHNLLWLADSVTEHRKAQELVEDGVMSEVGAEQVEDAVAFLLRLRHEMHFRTGKGVDLLSLRLQGEVAQAFDYPGEDILIQIESLMRDYYKHARNMRDRVKGAFQMMDLEMKAFEDSSLTSWFTWGGKSSEEEFDGFVASEGMLHAQAETVYEEDPDRLLRTFLHSQKRGLALAPSLRQLIKKSLPLLTEELCASEQTVQTLESIMGRRGQVGKALRRMHKLGVLGIVFPEFGALDCLVQHEFFHRYTADEHTLRCIDHLDRVSNRVNPKTELFSELFQDIEEPFALYLALLLHDTGRALNTDDHVDGSHVLAVQACDRLQINGERRKLILFLVDHHLTLFNIGTKKDIDDPEVIDALCREMKTKDRLDSLLVFTYCDSSGTHPDGWSGWKALAITTLYKRAEHELRSTTEERDKYLAELATEQRAAARERLEEKFWSTIDRHFEEMPQAYFRYRTIRSITKHVKAMWQYENRRARRPDTPFEAAVQWVEKPELGYTEVAIAASEKQNLLASICCALESHEINILSAHVHTRRDGVVLDIFQVATMQGQAVVDKLLQMQVVARIYALNAEQSYDPRNFIKCSRNLMDQKPMLVVIPVVEMCNEENEVATTVEVQATDRVGLLHDLLSLFAERNLLIKGARITTDRNTAIDTFLMTDTDGAKLSDEVMQGLRQGILSVATKED